MVQFICKRYQFVLAGFVFAFVAWLGQSAHAQTARLFVDAESEAVDPDGLSWEEAFDKLQDGLREARLMLEQVPPPSNVEIWVANGTYYPDEGLLQDPDDRAESFVLSDNMRVYGGFEGDEPPNEAGFNQRDPYTNLCILSGAIGMPSISDNTFHVVLIENVGIDSTILDGFVIRHGNGELAGHGGGGLIIEPGGPSSPRILRCIFEYNQAVNGVELPLKPIRAAMSVLSTASSDTIRRFNWPKTRRSAVVWPFWVQEDALKIRPPIHPRTYTSSTVFFTTTISPVS